MTAIIQEGSYVCSGKPEFIRGINFRPDKVTLKCGDGATHTLWWTPTSWVWRTQRNSAAASLANGLVGYDEKAKAFQIGDNATFGFTKGMVIYWAAEADNGAGVLRSVGHMGNGTTQRIEVGNLHTIGAPAQVDCKRDSARSPVSKKPGMTNSFFRTGSAPAADAFLTINADGTVDIGPNLSVNELSGATLGEGMDIYATWEKAGVIEHSSYVGNNTNGRTIALPANWAFFDILSEGLGIKSIWKTKSMPAGMVAGADATNYVNALSIVGNNIVFGSSNVLNTSGINYHLRVYCKQDGVQKLRRLSKLPTRKAIALSGSNSYIDCGSDPSLNITGAYTLEWFGSVRQLARHINVGYLPIMARSNGPEGGANVGKGLWNLLLGLFNYSDLDWAGPAVGALTTNYNDYRALENLIKTRIWRTGIITDSDPFHLMFSNNGNGGCRLSLQGELVKQRNIDVSAVTVGDAYDPRVNIGGGVGQRMVFGARWNGSAMGQFTRMTMLGATIYNGALTAAQVDNQFRRNFLGEDLPDIAFVERWLASNASGNILPAVNNPANNGTIVGGGVVKADYWL